MSHENQGTSYDRHASGHERQGRASAPVLQPHQARVLQEKTELDEKLEKLTDFLSMPRFAKLPEAERARMIRQEMLMRSYSDVLGQRIAAFEVDNG